MEKSESFSVRGKLYICKVFLYKKMNRKESLKKKQEFEKLFVTGKYTQMEIAQKIGISAQSISKWANNLPVLSFIEIKGNLLKELLGISKNPKGNEDLIDKYLTLIERIDTMIKKDLVQPKIISTKRKSLSFDKPTPQIQAKN